MILFDFECPTCALVFEELVNKEKLTHECPECGSMAARIISTPRVDPRLGLSEDFPTMAAKWERSRRARHKSEDWE